MTQSKEQVKMNIEHLTQQNFYAHKDQWLNEGPELEELAEGFWEVRRNREIERDERLEITLDDYKDWVRQEGEQIIHDYTT